MAKPTRQSGKQSLADDYFIESLDAAHRVLGEAEKLTVEEPLDIVLDQPWEAEQTQFSPAVYDESTGRFRLYYSAWIDGEQLICALDSDDGLSWERPSLGLVEWGGSKGNNITNCPRGGLMVFYDPHTTDAAHRWKRIDNKPTGAAADGSPVWRACHSTDGYDWQPYAQGGHSDQRMLFNFGSPSETFGGVIDPDARFVYYSQRGSGRRTRILGRRDSADGLNWSGLRTVIDQDLDDEPGTEFYAAGFDVANRTDGGLHVLMLHTFLTDLSEPYAIADPEKYWGKEESGPSAVAARVDGYVDTQLAVSRDTVSWTRYRQPFLPRGVPGAWDGGMLYGDGPILHDDRLWLFYSACQQSHNGRGHRGGDPPYVKNKSWGKGVATLRPDGWAHIEATSFAPGRLTTHRFRQESGGHIFVNVDAAAGELCYELLQDTGAPIPGFGLAECDPIRSDTLSAELSWNGKSGWPARGDWRPPGCENLSRSEFYVKLRFHIAPGTRLYSLTLDPPEVAIWGAAVPGRLD
jgi:hypothetical protein